MSNDVKFPFKFVDICHFVSRVLILILDGRLKYAPQFTVQHPVNDTHQTGVSVRCSIIESNLDSSQLSISDTSHYDLERRINLQSNNLIVSNTYLIMWILILYEETKLYRQATFLILY